MATFARNGLLLELVDELNGSIVPPETLWDRLRDCDIAGSPSTLQGRIAEIMADLQLEGAKRVLELGNCMTPLSQAARNGYELIPSPSNGHIVLYHGQTPTAEYDRIIYLNGLPVVIEVIARSFKRNKPSMEISPERLKEKTYPLKQIFSRRPGIVLFLPSDQIKNAPTKYGLKEMGGYIVNLGYALSFFKAEAERLLV